LRSVDAVDQNWRGAWGSATRDAGRMAGKGPPPKFRRAETARQPGRIGGPSCGGFGRFDTRGVLRGWL